MPCAPRGGMPGHQQKRCWCGTLRGPGAKERTAQSWLGVQGWAASRPKPFGEPLFGAVKQSVSVLINSQPGKRGQQIVGVKGESSFPSEAVMTVIMLVFGVDSIKLSALF